MILSTLVLAMSTMFAASSQPVVAPYPTAGAAEGYASSHALDSAVALRRLQLSTHGLSHGEFEYQSVCPECFKRQLACGKFAPHDTSFACVPESQDSLGTDGADK